jgi:hypothetical protein
MAKSNRIPLERARELRAARRKAAAPKPEDSTPGMKKLGIYLDNALWQRLRLAAFEREGVSFSQIVTEALDAFLPAGRKHP